MLRTLHSFRTANCRSFKQWQTILVEPRRCLNFMPPSKSSTPKLKILMLHGYTQNGQLFHAKTRALEKHLQKHFPGIALVYPTGPLELRPSDVPGFDLRNVSDPDNIEAYAWWRRADGSSPPEYVGLDEGLETIAKVIQAEGPFDGVMGFSQGAAMAAMIASLLEGGIRKEAFEKARLRSSHAISYPASFKSLIQLPLKFCVSYSGFVAPGERYQGFYTDPQIQTPLCHVIGSLDSVVEESRTQALVSAAGGTSKTQVVIHPGGHFVPNGKQYLDAVTAFIQTKIEVEQSNGSVQEERAEDMDVPF